MTKSGILLVLIIASVPLQGIWIVLVFSFNLLTLNAVPFSPPPREAHKRKGPPEMGEPQGRKIMKRFHFFFRILGHFSIITENFTTCLLYGRVRH